MKKWFTPSDFSRIPWSVLSDRHLKPIHKTLYGVLAAYERNGGMVRTGQDWLADSSGFSRRHFRTVLDVLVRRKHVEVMAAGRGSRNAYRLTDPIFRREEEAKQKRSAGGRLECDCCKKPVRAIICEGCMPVYKISEVG